MLSKERIPLQGHSSYPWETDALRFVREQLPDTDPYYLWELVELADPSTGRLHEIDCLVLGFSALYLVEIKSGPGEYTGDSTDWYRAPPGETAGRFMQPPLALTNHKAKVLRGLLERHLPREVHCPWVQPLVFLSAEELKLNFRGTGGQCVVTRKNFLRAVKYHELPGIAGARPLHPINKPQIRAIAQALRDIGVRESQAVRRVGSYELRSVIEEGPGYEDREAVHVDRKTIRRRARIYLVPQQTSIERRQTLLRAADREASLLDEVKGHPGILSFHDYVSDGPLGPTVLFDHFEGEPLDAFLRSHPETSFAERVEIVRQVGLALAHCHDKQVIHGGLCPGAVLLRRTAEHGIETRLYNFQLGGSENVSGTVHWSALAAAPWSAYQAPELRDNPSARYPVADVFSLGALAFFVLTGKPPGRSGSEVDQMLHQSNSHELDPRVVDDSISPNVADAIGLATQLKAVNRADEVNEWLHGYFLDAVTEPEPEQEETDPLQARKDDRLGGDLEVVKVLGQGASSRVLHVIRESDARELALKVALSPEDGLRLDAEARILEKLHHGNIVQLYERRSIAERQCLLMALAGNRTLSRELSEEGPTSLDFAARYGEELLLALRELENERVLHRDIKPGNIGVGTATHRSYRLTLFDFSLGYDLREPHSASAALSQVGVGTTVYRDPFLRLRGAWDFAADRWSAAVTLHEMLTTVRPSFEPEGSTAIDPDARIVIAAERFDATVRSALARFFARAFEREAAARFESAEAMRRAWNRAFEPQRRTPTPPPMTAVSLPVPALGQELGTGRTPGEAVEASGAEPGAQPEPQAAQASLAAAGSLPGAVKAPPGAALDAALGVEQERDAAGAERALSRPGPDLEAEELVPADLKLETPIATLPLSARAMSALDRAGLQTAGELLRLPENHLSAVRGVGRKVAREILAFRDACRKKLESHGTAASAGAVEPPFEAFFPDYIGEDTFLTGVRLPSRLVRILVDAGLDRLSRIAAAPVSQVESLLERGEASREALEKILKAEQQRAKAKKAPTDAESWLAALLPKQRARREHLLVAFGLQAPLLGEFEAPLVRAAKALHTSSANLSIAFSKAAEDWAQHALLPELRQLVHAVIDAVAPGLPVREVARLLLERLGQEPTDSLHLAQAAALARIVCTVERHEEAGLRWTRVGDAPWVVTDASLVAPLRELGRAADELAEREVVASPAEALRVLQARVEGTPLETLGDDALTALAAHASTRAARSSRLEIYPRGLSARRALELTSGVLTGELTPERIMSLTRGRYPEAEPLPLRPELDQWLEPMGLRWDVARAQYVRQALGAGTQHTDSPSLTQLPSRISVASSQREIDPRLVEERDFEERMRGAVQERRLRVVSVSKTLASRMALALAGSFGLKLVNLDELFTARLFQYMRAEEIPDENVFSADVLGAQGEDWPLLCEVMREVSDQLSRELFPVKEPTLLVQPGLLARFRLSGFVARMVEAAEDRSSAACFLLVPGSDTEGVPMINDVLPVPVTGVGDTLKASNVWLVQRHGEG